MFTKEKIRLKPENQLYRETNAQKTGSQRKIEHFFPPLVEANLLSMIVLLISFLVLGLYFFFSVGLTKSQDTTAFSDVDGGEGGGVSSLAGLYMAAGVSALEKQDLDTAWRSFDDSYRESPDFTLALVARSYVSLAQYDTAAALEGALLVLEQNPEETSVYYVLGAIYFIQGDYESSSQHFEIYLERVEQNQKAPVLMARLTHDNSVELAQAHIMACSAYLTAFDW